jgi:anti-sigma factor RsiW
MMATDWNSMSPAERLQFEQDLPWYINGSLDDVARHRVETIVRSSPRAAALLAEERALATSAERLLAGAPESPGLAQLQARLRENARPALRQRAAPGLREQVARWFGALASPQLAGAMMALAAVQFVVIGWMASSQVAPDDGMRGVQVAEMRTLRVHFADGVSERQIREALLAAAARIVGGPNQIGEYWIASDVASLAELQLVLEKQHVTSSIQEDKRGPQ